MQYIAAVSGNGAGVERVKNVIIEARRGRESREKMAESEQTINLRPKENAPAIFLNNRFYFSNSKTNRVRVCVMISLPFTREDG
jgi:hypothetical protein